MLSGSLYLSRSDLRASLIFFFFFNDTATTEIYTLSLHDALPISESLARKLELEGDVLLGDVLLELDGDRKSTRLNSSHGYISYAVFCLKKKKKKNSVAYQHKT